MAMDSIQAVSSSLEVLGDQYRVITGNLAHASSSGYKRRVTSFAQSLASLSAAGPAGPTGAGATGAGGTVVGSTGIDFSQGSLISTGRPLDVALDGAGFFSIETPNGPKFTRQGTFHLNAQGQLVDAAGGIVAGEGGPIVIPPTVSEQKVFIATDGQVYAGGQSVGKLKIVEFAQPAQLVPAGADTFTAPTGVASTPAKAARVHQGYQEASNVNTVDELVGLITVSRLYEANLKNVQAQDERMKTLLGVAMR